MNEWLNFIIFQYKCEQPEIKYITLDGRIPPAKRQLLVNDFQNKIDIKVCFASLGSSAEGITLFAACTMIICDVYWNLSKCQQISDRIHRIGQTKDVTIYSLFVLDSIEMRMKDLVEKKDQICKVIIDCKPITNETQSWLSKIIKLIE